MSNTDYVLGADLANMQAGGPSFLDTAGDLLTKGVGSAALSGLYGIVNTGVDLSNKVFGTEFTRADTSETLHNLDASWGDYYDKHKDIADVGGFIASSLIPGTLAVKGLKLLQTGNAAGAVGRVLGYTTRMESAYLNTALKELATEGGTVFSQINKAKAASIAWGTADNVLQTAAFEIGVTASMKASPILDNKSWGDIASDFATTSLIGGAIGGAIGGIFTNRLFKDAGKLVDKESRKYDVLLNPGKLALEKGDDSYSIIDAIFSLPKEVGSTEIKLSHGRKDILDTLDVSSLLDRKLRDSVSKGVEKFEGSLTNIVKNDTTIGKPFAKSLVSILKEGIEAKVPEETIRAQLESTLLNLHSVEAIGNRSTDLSGELRFLDPRGKISEKGGKVFSDVMPAGTKAADIYRVMGDESQATMGTLGKEGATKDEVFKKGFDFVLDPQSGYISVSPFSKIYAKAEDDAANFSPMFFNVGTKKTSFDVVPTIADVGTARTPLTVNFNGVQSGDKTFAFKTNKYITPADSVEATARHLWASNLPRISGEISSDDIAMLDALRNLKGDNALGVTIRDPKTGGIIDPSNINLDQFVFEQKYAKLNELLTGENADLRDIAYRLNVTGDWVEAAVSSKLDKATLANNPGWKADAARFAERENLIVRYNTKQLKESAQFPDGITAYHARVEEATQRAKDAAKTVLGEKYDLLQDIDGNIAKTADSQGVGAGFVTSSNANYTDRLRAWAQNTGLYVDNISRELVNSKLLDLQGPAAKILQNPEAAAEISAATTAGRLSTEPMGLYQDLFSGQWMMVDLKSLNKINSGGKIQFAKRIPLSEDAGEFLSAYHQQHALRVDKQKVLASAQGTTLHWDPNRLYFPPVDTQRVPFFAFVRQSDGSLFGTSEVSMLTARDAGELKRLATEVEKDPSLRVIYKSNTEDYYKAKGDYEFGRTLNEPKIDSHLRSQGKLGSYLPNMTPQAVIEDYINFTQRAETKIVRDAVAVNYAQPFAELGDLSKRHIEAQTSKMEGLSKLLQRNVTDPFDDTIKLALNISKRSEFTLWHQANEFVDALGTKAWRGISGAFNDAKDGKISWQDANGMLEKFGLGSHFRDADAFAVAQSAPDRNLLQVAVRKANMLLANGMLRLDFANSLLNIVSTPVLLGAEVSSIRNSLKQDPAMIALFESSLGLKVPGTELSIPSTTKLLFNAVSNRFGDTGTALMNRYRAIGSVKGKPAEFYQMIDEISMVPGLIPSKYAQTVDKWVEKGASMTFNTQAEEFTRFVSADVMRQITEPVVAAGKMSIQEQNNYINIFVNRVQGNYVASQRPMMFQGTIGAAVGLFQTYQFNMFQQLYRHIENRDLKTLAVAGGLQASLFGANGLPFFGGINTHIIGNAGINSNHQDMYSYAVKGMGKDIGDWMMYGTASAFPLFSDQAPALWTRGDLNPRYVTMVPTDIASVPAVQASMKVIGAVVGMAKQVSTGSDMLPALLHGLEHNGLNRPLAGLAQVLQGASTTTKGNLISASQDWLSIANASRLLGAKPMDESIALTEMWRGSAYKAVTKERIDLLGSVVKEKMRNGQPVSTEDWLDFQGRYAASGGRIQGFGEAMNRWSKDSRLSVVNELARHNNTMAGQRMMEVMGGDSLADYSRLSNEN